MLMPPTVGGSGTAVHLPSTHKCILSHLPLQSKGRMFLPGLIGAAMAAASCNSPYLKPASDKAILSWAVWLVHEAGKEPKGGSPLSHLEWSIHPWCKQHQFMYQDCKTPRRRGVKHRPWHSSKPVMRCSCTSTVLLSSWHWGTTTSAQSHGPCSYTPLIASIMIRLSHHHASTVSAASQSAAGGGARDLAVLIQPQPHPHGVVLHGTKGASRHDLDLDIWGFSLDHRAGFFYGFAHQLGPRIFLWACSIFAWLSTARSFLRLHHSQARR